MIHLAKKINQFSLENDLLREGDGIVVGVSGGPDSRVLLDILVKLSRKYALKLRVAHVNASLRGLESDADEVFVRSLAEKYNLPVSVERVRAIPKGVNLEAHLRDIRYRFFHQLCVKYDLQSIAVAHTQDDQAETFLLHLLRGAGLHGLRAMLPRNNTVIRPLLGVNRTTILGYCREENLTFRTDASNKDVRFTRNRIRHRLLPYLERNFNPSIKNILAQTATVVGETYALSSGLACQSSDFSGEKSAEKAMSIPLGEFRNLSRAEQRRKLRSVVESFGLLLAYRQYDELLKIVRSDKGKIHSARIGGLNISRKGDTMTVSLS